MHAYLDNNATTRPADEVVAAMHEMLTAEWANPSSVHRFGQRARQRVELAREQVARLINCSPRELIFTSGATESNNAALRGLLDARAPRRTIITTPIEHAAIREPCEALAERGCTIVNLPAGADGLVNVDALDAALDEHSDDVALVAIHYVNNETGVIQPIDAIGARCREAGTPLLCDATQAIGKLPVDVKTLPVDVMSFSGHKLHGPKGVGGLYLRRRIRVTPQQRGGPHERERRGGTENTPGIVGLGVAADLARQWLETDGPQRGAAQRDRLQHAITHADLDAVVNCTAAPRVWNTLSVAFPPLEAEAILLLLSERGVSASAGAACSSGSLEPSPVLLAMNLPEPVAHATIRLSISRETTDDEINYPIEQLPAVIHRLRKSMTEVS